MESIIIKVPNKADAKILLEICRRMGFKAESFEKKLKRFTRNAPKNVPITDEEIMEEIHDSRERREDR